jgi:hypothetical protein
MRRLEALDRVRYWCKIEKWRLANTPLHYGQESPYHRVYLEEIESP